MASGRGASSRWFFTREQLENTPSRRCGVEADEELSHRQQAANLIQDMGQRLNVSQLTINTAIVYMHRFYMQIIFISYCLKQHTHKTENKHVQGDSAAWTNALRTRTYTARTVPAWHWQKRLWRWGLWASVPLYALENPTITTTILQRLSTAGSCLPGLSFITCAGIRDKYICTRSCFTLAHLDEFTPQCSTQFFSLLISMESIVYLGK